MGFVLSGIVLAFLILNLWYRVSTIFDFSRFISGLFICLSVCSLVVIVFPRFLKGFLCLFGASFFMFGFRAYDIQSQVFETVVVFVAITLFIRIFRGLRRLKESDQEINVLNKQLMALVGCYVVLSALSLMLLPIGHIVKDLWLFGYRSFFLQVANATPNSWLFPLAGMNRLLLFLVFAVAVARTRESRDLFRWIFIGIFVGGVFCVFIGLLDYYGLISLKWYRFNTTSTPGALHSTFLNRSWLAEFILMMAPFVLIGFMSKIMGLWWKVLLLGSLVLCEIALLLGGARGGWVSYPLILFVCWLFFYFTKEGRLESFNFRWRDLVKVAVSVPITIVISLLLIFYVIMPLSNIGRDDHETKDTKGGPRHTTQYIERQATRIVEPSGRLKAWTQGLDVGKEQPWFGMGYEAFCWHANILSGIQDSIYTINKDNKHKRILDTPHNIYFQLFVSGGIIGLCFWALVIAYTLLVLVVDLIRNKRLLNVPVIISIISFHTYGLFQSMQYIPMIWMFIFLALGYAMTIDEKVLPERMRRATGWVIKGMVVLVLIGGVVYFVGRGSQDLADKYGLNVYAQDQDWHNYLGFYHKEKWGKRVYRWSGKRGLIKIAERGTRNAEHQAMRAQEGAGGSEEKTERRRDGGTEGLRGRRGKVVGFDVQCHTPGVEKEPVRVTVSLDGEVVDEIVFDRKGSEERWYYVGQGSEVRGQRSEVEGRPQLNTPEATPVQRGKHEVLFEVSRTWNPREMGISEDPRDLGVAVGEVEVKEMPEEGVGFYKWEELDAQNAERVEQGAASIEGERVRRAAGERLRFRWTGRRASLPIEGRREEEREGLRDEETKGRRDGNEVVFLACHHPDIGEKPVVVKVFGDGEVLRYVEFKDFAWKRVEIGPEELKGKEVLTYKVSRTWNPKRMGVSGDDRDLGVAVAIP